MTQDQSSWIAGLLLRIFAERAVDSVSQWCEQNLIFNEPDCRGPFDLRGREYLREPLDNWGREEVTDQVFVSAPRMGKTRVIYGGIGWTVIHSPARILSVMAKSKGPAGAEDAARTRLIPMFRASPQIAALIPTGGNRRHEFKTPQQIIGGSIIDHAGSNSVAALASNPCRVVVQDEVEKFNTTRKRDESGSIVEADASALADERCKEYPNPKRFKASTPTLTTGKIWEELTKRSDFRRYFVPCPHCSKHVLLAWSEEFTLLPKLGCEAWMRWDGKKSDGSWDKATVEKTAHYECPFCKGHIEDRHKAQMIAAGEWRPTREGGRGYRGYHLPAMYALHSQCNAGAMAVRFIESVRSIAGPRGFINNDLAEPFSIQGVPIDRKGIAGKHIEVTGEWLKIISVDFQELAPYFWAVCRAWNGSDKSHGLEYRSFNQWAELDDFQRERKVIPAAVIIDVGFSQAQVLQECANLKIESRCELAESVQGQLPEVLGWTPAKSFGGKRLYREEESGLYLPLRSKRDVDPYAGTDLAKKMRIELLEFLNDIFEDMLDNIRSGGSGLQWTIAPEMDTPEYHQHMAGKVRRAKRDNPREYKWESRSREFPDHLHSCELLNFVLAYRLQLISFDAIQAKRKDQIPNTHPTNETASRRHD